MHRSMVEALKSPEVVAKLKETDQDVVASTPAQAADRLEVTSRKWGEVARRIGLRLD